MSISVLSDLSGTIGTKWASVSVTFGESTTRFVWMYGVRVYRGKRKRVARNENLKWA